MQGGESALLTRGNCVTSRVEEWRKLLGFLSTGVGGRLKIFHVESNRNDHVDNEEGDYNTG